MTMTREDLAREQEALRRAERLRVVARLADLADVPAPSDSDGPVAVFLLGVSDVLTAELVERRRAYPEETLAESGRAAVETEEFREAVVRLVLPDPANGDAARLGEFAEDLSPDEADSLPSFVLVQVVGKRLGDALVAGSEVVEVTYTVEVPPGGDVAEAARSAVTAGAVPTRSRPATR